MAQAFRSTRVMTPQGLATAGAFKESGRPAHVRAGADPNVNLLPALIVEEDGRIADVRSWNDVPEGVALRDFSDGVILPGLVDTHVHINEPGRTEWEGFWTATRAAAAGGVTTLVDMPLNCVPETTNVGALEAKRAAAQGKAWVDWAAWGGVVRGNAGKIKSLIDAGVPGFKCFLIDSGVDGFAWVDEAELRLALEQLRGTGLPLLVHAEVAGPVNEATAALNSTSTGWRRYSTYLASRPQMVESDAIALLLRMAEEFRTPIHVVHLSSGGPALMLLESARKGGLPITVETCPHYLWFDAEEIPDGATEYKCAPPIRRSENRGRLWKALEDGVIDMVVTDHSPCPPEMKRREDGRFDKAWGGIAGLGLALPVMWTAMRERGLSMERIAEWMAAAPARLAGFAGRKGVLAAGADADFVVFDPDPAWKVAPKDLHFRHKLSPYLGAKLRGCVLETWLRGKCVFSDGQFIDEPRGRELVRR